MSRLTVGSIEGLTENSNVISVPTGHTLNAVDGLQIGGVGVGEYVDYSGSMTFTNFTLGDGTVQSFYTRVNDLVHYVGRIILGSTSSVTGSWLVSLPVNAQVMGNYIPGTAVFIDSGATFYSGYSTVSSDTNVLAFRAPKITATYTRWDTVGASVPMSWGTGDELHFNITYKAA